MEGREGKGKRVSRWRRVWRGGFWGLVWMMIGWEPELSNCPRVTSVPGLPYTQLEYHWELLRHSEQRITARWSSKVFGGQKRTAHVSVIQLTGVNFSRALQQKHKRAGSSFKLQLTMLARVVFKEEYIMDKTLGKKIFLESLPLCYSKGVVCWFCSFSCLSLCFSCL